MIYAFITCATSAILTIFLYALLKLCALLIDVLHGLDQLNGRMDYIGKSLAMQGVFTFGAFVAIYWFTQNLELSILGMAIVTALIGIFYDYPRAKQFERIKIGITRKKAIHLLIYCFPIVIAAVAASATPSIPRQILAAMNGDAALGIYASVAAPVAIIQMGASYVYNPLLTSIAKVFYGDTNKSFAKLMVKITLLIATLGIACAILLEFFGGWLLGLLYGDSILPYTYLLMPVIISTFLSAYIWFLNDASTAVRCFRGNFVSNFATLIASIAASVPFISLWDMNGVSFTTMAAFVVGIVILIAFLIWHCKRPRAIEDECD